MSANPLNQSAGPSVCAARGFHRMGSGGGSGGTRAVVPGRRLVD